MIAAAPTASDQLGHADERQKCSRKTPATSDHVNSIYRLATAGNVTDSSLALPARHSESASHERFLPLSTAHLGAISSASV